MRRRPLANLALAFAVAAAAAAVALWKPAPPPAAPAPLTQLEPDSVRNIEVERAEGGALRFERRGRDWVMTAPVHAPAYAARIDSVLGVLGEPSHAEFDAAGAGLARFKLDAPAVTLRLDSLAIDFGDTDPLDQRRYVRVNGRVHLIADTLYFQLTQNPGFFIDPKLLPAGAQPARIVYPGFTLTREDGKWRQEPDSGLSAESLKQVGLAWEEARAITVRTPIEGSSIGEVSVEAGEDAPLQFQILPKGDDIILGRADLNVQYHLDSYTAEQLLLRNPVKSDK